jgi:hypothetical protein
MTTPPPSAEDGAARTCTGEDGRPLSEDHAIVAAALGNATSRRRNVSSSKRIRARTETNHPDEPIGADSRATVAGMLGSPASTAETVTVSAHTAEHYQHRVTPALDLHAALRALEPQRATGESSPREPAWLGAANPAPYGDAIALPHARGRVTTTCVTRPILTPTRREAKAQSTHMASLKPERRRTRC